MPVQKFKSYQDAREALWCFSPDDQYYQQIKEFWYTVSCLRPMRRYPHGVSKFKSVDEASAKMDEWVLKMGKAK